MTTLPGQPPRSRKGLVVTLAVIAMLVVMLCTCIGISTAINRAADPIASPSTSKAGASISPLPTSEVDPGWIAGTYKVGTEIPPGSYKTTGAGVKGDALGGCYWARLKDASGEVSSIIANGNLESGASGKLQVKATDTFIEFTGDCAWHKA